MVCISSLPPYSRHDADAASFTADTDIIHLDVAGKSIVVLDSYEAAVELLEKRSKVYSDR